AEFFRSARQAEIHSTFRFAESLGREMDESAGIGVFQHPQRAIGALLYVADADADIPALGGLGAAVAVKSDAEKCLRSQAADEAAAVPLGKRPSARVKHQIARRDHRYPIDH